MANTVKVTVTMPRSMLEGIRRLVADGRAESVSAFVTAASSAALEVSATRADTLAGMLAEADGELSASEAPARWVSGARLNSLPPAGRAASEHLAADLAAAHAGDDVVSDPWDRRSCST